MTQRRVKIVFDVDTGQVTQRIGKVKKDLGTLQSVTKRAGRDMDRFGSSVKGAGHSLFKFVVIIGQARNAINNLNMVTTGWIRMIIDTNREMEQLTQLMKGFSTSTDEVTRSQEALAQTDFLFNLAEKAPFALKVTTDAFVKFKAAGIDPTKGSLEALIGAVANFGGTDQHLKRASIAIQQMSGKGVISMEELRQQLGESVPSAIRIMAEELQVSYGTLVKEISKGSVKSQAALDAMFRGFRRAFGHRAQELMETFNGQLAIFQTRFTKLQLLVGKNGFSKGLTDGMKELNEQMASSEFRQFAADMGRFLSDALKTVTSVVKIMHEYGGTIKFVGTALVVAFGGGLVVRMIKGIGVAALGSVGGLSQLRTNIIGYGAAIKNINGTLANANAVAMGHHKLLINETAGAWSKLGNTARISAAKQARAAVAAAAFGPILGIISLIATLAATWLLVSDNANEAFRSMVRGVNFFNSKADVEKAKEALLEEALAVGKLIKKRERLSEILSRKSTSGVFRKNLAAKEAELQSEILARVKDVAAAKENLAKSEFIFRADQIRALVALDSRYTEVLAGEINKRYNAESARIKDLATLTADNRNPISEKEAQAKRLTAAKKHGDEMVAMWKESLQKQADVVVSSNSSKKMIEAAEQLGFDYRKKLQLALSDRTALDQKDPLISAMIGDSEKALERYTKRIVTKVKNLRIQLAGEKAKVAGENDFLARAAEDMVAANGLEKLSVEDLEKVYLKLAKALGEAKDKTKDLDKAKRDKTAATKSAATAVSKMNSLMKTAIVKQNQLSGAMSHPALTRMNKEYLKFQNTISKVINKVKELAKTNSNLKELAASLAAQGKDAQDVFKNAQVEGLAQTLEAETQNLLDSLATQEEARGRAFQSQKRRLESLLNLEGVYGRERVRLNEAVYAKIEALQKKLERANRGALQKWAEDMKPVGMAVEASFTGLLDGFVDDLADGKIAFADFAKSMLKHLIKIILKALIAKAILSAIGLGNAGGAGSSGGSTPSVSSFDQSFGISTAHTGGIIGADTLASKMVPASSFASAERFHTGGVIGGLKSNEVPIITEKGEGVFTKEQMKAMGVGLSSPKIELNIINQSNTPLNAEQTGSRNDGAKMIVDVIVQAMGRPGPMRDAVRTTSRGSQANG